MGRPVNLTATPWVREVLTAVERDAIDAVVPAGANLRLSCNTDPIQRRDGAIRYRSVTYTALIGLNDRSSVGTGKTPLAATLVAVHGLEGAA